MLLYAGKQCRSGQDEYFQFRFQFRADDEVVFLIGVADVFCTDESSQADAPVNGFQVAGQGSVITAVHKKVLTLVMYIVSGIVSSGFKVETCGRLAVYS